MAVATKFCNACGAANDTRATVCARCGRPLAYGAAAPNSAAVRAAADHPTGLMPPNALLAHRYLILGQAGRGGMGAVYKARDQQTGGRIVAVKELSQNGLSPQEQAEAVQTFRHEADLLSSLKHPGLPRIYNYFNEGGRWYLVMDFIEGQTLDQRLRQLGGRPMPVDQVLRIGIYLCAVLTYLHTRRPPIIFRDLKPANVMLTATGSIVLIDFGIARIFKPGKTSDTISFGSPGYAAPEQYGKAQTTVRSDVYSLGATLHQLLTGVDPSIRPFEFVPVRTRNPQVPEELAALIARMVQLDERTRPADTASVQRELEIIQGRMKARSIWPQAQPRGTKFKPPKVPKPTRAPKVRKARPTVLPVQPRVVPVVAPTVLPLRHVVYPAPPVAQMRGSKRGILILSLVSLCALAGFLIESGRGLEFFVTAGTGGPQFLFAMLWLAVGIGCWLVAWIMTLVRATQLARWGWFLVMMALPLFLGPFGTLLYGLFGPVERPK